MYTTSKWNSFLVSGDAAPTTVQTPTPRPRTLTHEERMALIYAPLPPVHVNQPAHPTMHRGPYCTPRS